MRCANKNCTEAVTAQDSDNRWIAITSDMTQVTSRATSSLQSTSTARHSIDNSRVTSSSRRQTSGLVPPPSVDDQSSQQQTSPTQAPMSVDASVAVVAGVIPINSDVAERLRHSSSTSAGSASTAGRGPASSSSLTPVAPTRRRRQRHAREHATQQQVPATWTAPQRPSTANNASESTSVAGCDESTPAALATANHDDDVVVRGPPSTSATADTSDLDGPAPSELDVTRPALPKRRLQSAKQLPSSYSRSSNMTSSTEEPVPANWAAPQRSSAVNDAGALTTVSGSVEPTSTALEPSAAVTVFNDDEYDATLPRAPPRRHRRHSAEQLRRLYAQLSLIHI